MTKVAVLGRDSISTRLLIYRLSEAGYHVIWHEERRDDRVELMRRRVKKFGVTFVFSQLIFQILQRVIFKFSESRVKEIVGDLRRFESFTPDNVDKNINEANLSYLLDRKVDLIILSGTRILSPQTLSALEPIRIINIHAGITPKYRGVHGGYWSLANHDRENFGATIHFVDSGVDTGGVISHVRLVPEKKDNFSTYPLLQQASAINVLLDLIPEILHGRSEPRDTVHVDEKSDSKVWTHPTIFQYLNGYLKYGVK
ncbi:MAG: hypothetical protein FH752_19095 [Marinobacter adhaerens]|uniref:phosphoribosylglycinamide formyltransferase 1 n=1 Tax=Marinobacter adhaerens TaxID=1033846 RepID=A0A844I4J2_9GAMM|nr:hypothetical protein [Marinobacter adhaerens]